MSFRRPIARLRAGIPSSLAPRVLAGPRAVRVPVRGDRNVAVLALAVAALGLVLLAPVVGAAQVGVSIQARSYVPGQLTVRVGDTVTWTVTQIAKSDQHSVTSGTPGSAGAGSAFDSGIVLNAKGATYSVTFKLAGTYAYFCRVHPTQMTGTITVVAAATPPPTAAPTRAPTAVPTIRPTAAPASTASAAPASPTPASSASPGPSASAAPSGSPMAEASSTPAPAGSGAASASPGASGATGPAEPRPPIDPIARPVAVVILLLTLATGLGLLVAYRRFNR